MKIMVKKYFFLLLFYNKNMKRLEEDFWREFCQKKNIDIKTAHTSFIYGKDSDYLAKLTYLGEKSATCSLKKLYTEEDELPYKNEYSIVLDKEEIPVCIIKTDRVRIIPFYQADERHAQKEGEGDKTLSYFRKVHIDFFKEECEKANTFFSEDDLIVIEEFHLEYKNKNYVFSK